MGLLSGNALQSLFGGVLAGIYEDAVLEIWGAATVRDPATGAFPFSKLSEQNVKVQRDACTEAQRQAEGYTVNDMRFMILQNGVSVAPNSDSRLRYRGATYRLFAPIEQDPARVYWDARGREF